MWLFDIEFFFTNFGKKNRQSWEIYWELENLLIPVNENILKG